VGLHDGQVRRRRQHPLPTAPAPADRPQHPQPPRRQQDRALRRAVACTAPQFASQIPPPLCDCVCCDDRFVGSHCTLQGMLTGLLGNLSLLSYFAKKKETEAVIVQTLGVISTYAVLVQLAMAESMPVPQFVATSVVVAAGLILNFLNYFGWIPGTLLLLWEDFITVGGLAVLPQVKMTVFALTPYNFSWFCCFVQCRF
jgi:hypothetical protein